MQWSLQSDVIDIIYLHFHKVLYQGLLKNSAAMEQGGKLPCGVGACSKRKNAGQDKPLSLPWWKCCVPGLAQIHLASDMISESVEG